MERGEKRKKRTSTSRRREKERIERDWSHYSRI